jgi:hypothetical protein
MTDPRTMTELDLLRSHALACVRTETRLHEMRGAKLTAAALAYQEYAGEREERDSFLSLWRRLYGNALIFAERTANEPPPGRAA